MNDKVKVSFASMSPTERLRLVTQGASISSYAKTNVKPLPRSRTREIGRIVELALQDFKRVEKLDTAP